MGFGKSERKEGKKMSADLSEIWFRLDSEIREKLIDDGLSVPRCDHLGCVACEGREGLDTLNRYLAFVAKAGRGFDASEKRMIQDARSMERYKIRFAPTCRRKKYL